MSGIDRNLLHGRNTVGAALSLTVLAIALWFLDRELSGLSWDTVGAQMGSVPITRLLVAVLSAIASYLVLTGYDAIAVRYVGRRLPYRQTAITAFMAYAVGHNVGVAALSAGSVRYRLYSLLGLSGSEIARIVLFATLTFGLGASLLLGAALLISPAWELVVLPLPPAALRSVGAVLMAVPVVYLLTLVLRSSPVAVGNWRIPLPRPGIGVAQIALSTADLVCAAAVLYVLLAQDLGIGFLPFLGCYLIAIAAGLLSSVPGGVGVFEAVLLAMFPGAPRSTLLVGMIVYRLIYYIAPLTVALLFLALRELREHRRILRRTLTASATAISSLAPQNSWPWRCFSPGCCC